MTCADAQTVGPCRGGQPEGVIFHDVTIGARAWRPHRPRGAARPLARSRGVQRNVAIAASGGRVVAAFEQDGRVLVARSGDGGAHWAKPVAPLAGARQWWPSVSIRGREVWLAAQVDDHVVWARSGDGGQTFGAQQPVDSPAETWRPSVAATAGGAAYLAWIDTRDRFALDDLPQAGSTARGCEAGTPARLDSTAPPDDLARTLDNAWAPSVAARGKTVVVAWIDFHSYDWDVRATSSGDRGATFGHENPVNVTPKAIESLEASPHAAIGATGPLVAFTDWRKSPNSAHAPSSLYDIELQAFGDHPIKIDGTGPTHVRRVLAGGRGRAARRARGLAGHAPWSGRHPHRPRRAVHRALAPHRRPRQGGQRLAPGDRGVARHGDRRLGGRPRRPIPGLRPPDAATLHPESPVNDDLPRSSERR